MQLRRIYLCPPEALRTRRAEQLDKADKRERHEDHKENDREPEPHDDATLKHNARDCYRHTLGDRALADPLERLPDKLRRTATVRADFGQFHRALRQRGKVRCFSPIGRQRGLSLLSLWI